jgi:hypothetical protein
MSKVVTRLPYSGRDAQALLASKMASRVSGAQLRRHPSQVCKVRLTIGLIDEPDIELPVTTDGERYLTSRYRPSG